MRESYWAYWLVLLGVFVIGVMLLVNNISTTNTQDYYNIKEVTQASMIDAVDFSYYRLYGNVKMSEAKFVENFTRRFVENVNMANTYDVKFYDLYEVPPKVSVRVSTGSRSFNIANSRNDYDVVTTINAVLDVGSQGEAGERVKPEDSKICVGWFGSKLLRYLKGETVDGHSINSDIRIYPDLASFKIPADKLSSVNTPQDLVRLFGDGTIKYGGKTINQYFNTTAYNDLPDFIKMWESWGQEWLEIRK